MYVPHLDFQFWSTDIQLGQMLSGYWTWRQWLPLGLLSLHCSQDPINTNVSVQFITHPCCPILVMPAFSRLPLQAICFSLGEKKPFSNIIKEVTAQKSLLMAKPFCQSTSHRLLCWVLNVKTANRDVQANAGAMVIALPGTSSNVLQNDCLKVSIMVTDLQMPVPWWGKACCFLSLISLALLKNIAEIEIQSIYHSDFPQVL